MKLSLELNAAINLATKLTERKNMATQAHDAINSIRCRYELKTEQNKALDAARKVLNELINEGEAYQIFETLREVNF